MDTVFALTDGDPALAPDAKPRPDFYAQLERERSKVGTGMISKRYQRMERRLLGRQVGPDTLEKGGIGAPAGSLCLSASAPDEPGLPTSTAMPIRRRVHCDDFAPC